ncbi:hypothetical protein SUGI_0956330 [Cryptomeria japonica]|nr:hypothetical protein SUGI_0956330 [Cryptomeria japonica]
MSLQGCSAHCAQYQQFYWNISCSMSHFIWEARKLSPIGKVAFWRGFVVNRERVFFGQCGLSDGRLAVGFSGIAKLFEDGGKLFTGDTSGLCGTLWWQSVFE